MPENKYRSERAGSARRRRDVAQNASIRSRSSPDVAMHTRLVAGDRVALDHEERLLRIAAAENIDQHAAKLAGDDTRHLAVRLLRIGGKLGRGERAQKRRQPRGIDLPVPLDGLDGAVERQVLAGSRRRSATARRRSPGSSGTGRSASRQDATTFRAAAAVHQHVVLVTGKPGVEPVEQPVEPCARDHSRCCVPNMPDRGFARATTPSTASPNSGRNRLLPSTDHDQIVVRARLTEIAEREVMHSAAPGSSALMV